MLQKLGSGALDFWFIAELEHGKLFQRSYHHAPSDTELLNPLDGLGERLMLSSGGRFREFCGLKSGAGRL